MEINITQLIGRTREKRLIDQFLESDKAEFVAVTGRRRVGKTFLIREYISSQMNNKQEFYYDEQFFKVTGNKNGSMRVQLSLFQIELERVFPEIELLKPLKNWNEAFDKLFKALKKLFESNASTSNKRFVIFLDELPWLATKRSGLVEALDHFWNTKLSTLHNVKLIVCGSAATWMNDHLVNATGGLYNRITRLIKLLPFSLAESEQFLKALRAPFSRLEIIELYLAFGGIPHYLSQIDPNRSLTQNIGDICFEGLLRDEFSRLFKSLFVKGEDYEKLIRAAAKRRSGSTMSEIAELGRYSLGGGLAGKLKELEDSGFLESYIPLSRGEKIYRVRDPFVWFSIHWIEKGKLSKFSSGAGEQYWTECSKTASFKSWKGYAFESICLDHESTIRHALGIDKIFSEVRTFRYIPKKSSKISSVESGAQIDLLFDRADGVVTLCEVKYSSSAIEFDREMAENLKQKMNVFAAQTKSDKRLSWALIAPKGLKPNTWSEGLIDQVVTLDQLFL
jgi:AAA+ ATPase superfamily predicted ATPase